MQLEHMTKVAATKQRESLVMSQAYAATLGALGPANFVLVVGAALLSLVAGATILVENNLLTNVGSGVIALVSSALTIVHARLGCEQYQAECRKLVSFHRGLAEDYSNLAIIADAHEFEKRFAALNDQLSVMIKSSTALPFDWALRRARKRAE